MPNIFIFGLGFTAHHIAARLRGAGWHVDATGRNGNLAFEHDDTVRAALAGASHVLSSVPPQQGDPVLERYGDALGGKWLGYLSSTGVYGDTQGAWVDESAPIGGGRRSARAQADECWLELGAHVFRLPGIYGSGRSALDRVAAGKAKRIVLPGQVFSRVHVDDIASGVVAALDAPPGAYNLADDLPCSQNAVIEMACRLLDLAPPPMLSLEDAGLSPQARAFYSENRRVANGKSRRVLGWTPQYPTFKTGLRALAQAIDRSTAMEGVTIARHQEGDRGEYRAHVVGSAHIGRLSWVEREDGVHVAEHTVVSKAIGGRGIAGALVSALIADAREQGFKIDPQCSYVASKFDKNPDWADLRAT